MARLLAVKEGDAVMLDLPKTGGIPAESAFGRKRVSVETMRLKVARVIPAEGLGRFGLRPNQRVPRNAYVSLAALQAQLQEPGRVNAILRPTPPPGSPWHPQLADYGIHVEPSPRGYIQVTTEQMIFPPAVEQALLKQLGGLDVQPALTYLANTIACGKLEVPYSTITAIDFQDEPPLGPFLSTDGSPVPKLGDGQIALNTWAAERLKARVGDSIRVTFFEPESNFGLLKERSVDLRLAAIVKLEGAAADKDLTPTVRGLTDKATIEDWDLPFEIQRRRIKPDDDKYWTKYGATPKAFVSLATGRRLWASRFGQTTALRIRPHGGNHGPDACPAARSRPGGAGVRLPADQGPGPRGRGRHDALRRALPGVQLLRDRRGGDARRALVPLGDRATRETRGVAVGPGISPAADHATSGGRGPVGGDRGKPDRHAGRRGLRGADAASGCGPGGCRPSARRFSRCTFPGKARRSGWPAAC